jgi:hypothetical protein
MTPAHLRALACLASFVLAAGAVYGCSLNPQPLPPGETAEAGASGGSTTLDATTGASADGAPIFGGGEAGGGALTDSSTDGGTSQPPGTPDGGDGGVAGDAAQDAPQDGPTDAATDGQEDGG